MPISEDRQLSCARAMYSSRASTYDATWHVYQGFDFTRIAELSYGQHVLDLAAGTGLVAIPARKAVGPRGTITAIDITQEMLDIGIAKAQAESLDIKWLCHDVKRLNDLQNDLRHGGYDVITCASALALFDDPLEVVKRWVQWLRPGGILVVDMITERTQISGLAFETALRKLGQPLPFNRTWVTSQEKFKNLFIEAGLLIEKSFVATGYWDGCGSNKEEPDTAWDKLLVLLKTGLREEEKEPAKQLFLKDFQDRFSSHEHLESKEEEGFYTVVARKPLD